MSRWKDKQEFKDRVYHFAERLDVKVKAVSIRPMSAKWASCSTAGYLNFNTELLEMERKVGDYVIVHELLHFSVPNHGKLWKSLMRAHLGAYEDVEKRLRRLSPLTRWICRESLTGFHQATIIIAMYLQRESIHA